MGFLRSLISCKIQGIDLGWSCCGGRFGASAEAAQRKT